MQKKLIGMSALALVCSALAERAQAQDSLTIAGRVDLGPQYIDDGTAKMKRLDSGTYTSSRLIFKGTEDLGDGLTAGFYLESRFNADTGAPQSAAKYFNAGAQVNFGSKTFGSVTLGRQYVPIFWSFLFADDTGPLRLHGYSAVQSVQRSAFGRIAANVAPVKTAGSLDSIAGGIYQLNITSAFEDNLVVYQSPTIAGASLRLAVAPSEGSPAGGGRVLGSNFEYRGGPVFATLAWNQKRGTVPAGGGGNFETATEAMAGGLYKVTEAFHLWGNVHPWKFTSPGVDFKGHDWMLGASYWFPKSELWVNYAAKTLQHCTDCNSKGFGVGYHYFLSKKTELYASVAQVANNANSGNGLNGFVPGALGQTVRGYAAGLALTF